MIFLQPWILYAIPLAFLPVAIHLMNRMRHRVVRWGAMMFLLKAARSSTRMSRIKWWMILISRVLAVLALIVALAKPLAGGWLGWRLAGDPDCVMLLLDRSASMGANAAPGKSKRERGLKLVADAGAKMAASSRRILIDNALLVPTEIPGWDVLDQMDATKSSQTAADIPAMLRKSLDYALENHPGRMEVWVVSDMQYSNWRPESLDWAELDSGFAALPTKVAFRILALDAPASGNAALTFERMTVKPEGDGKLNHGIVVDVRGNNAQSGEIPLTVRMADGSSHQILVRCEGRAMKTYLPVSRSDTKKICFGSVSLPSDTNPEDNTVFFVASPPVLEDVLIVSNDLTSTRILIAAAAPEGEKAFQKSAGLSSLSQFNHSSLTKTALVVWQLPFPNGDALKRLRDFASAGGVVLFLPPATRGASTSNGIHWGAIESFNGEKGGALLVGDWNRREGPLADAISGEPLALDDLRILKVRRIAGVEDMEPVATDSEGKSLIAKKQIGDGVFYFCSTLPTEKWSNLGEGLVLVPFMRRLANFGARRLAKASFRKCGQWKPKTDTAVRLYPKSKENSEVGGIPVAAGVFQAANETVVLNRPSIEDASGVLEEGVVKRLLKSNSVSMFHEAGGASAGGKMADLWWFFVVGVLAFLTLEGLLCLPGRFAGEPS